MPFLIAVAGLSGSGKTTAIRHFENFGIAERVYLGQIVINEVEARQLPLTADNERSVRIDLREKNGPAFLAILGWEFIEQGLKTGKHIFVDAVFSIEEYEFLQTSCQSYPFVLLAVDAAFEIRAERLRSRPERPLNRDELKKRDEMEISKLGTLKALESTRNKIVNEGTVEAFQANLEKFWTTVSGQSIRG